VFFDRLFADPELMRDLLVFKTGRNELEDRCLAVS